MAARPGRRAAVHRASVGAAIGRPLDGKLAVDCFDLLQKTEILWICCRILKT